MASLKVSFLLCYLEFDICSRYNFLLYCVFSVAKSRVGQVLPDDLLLFSLSDLIIFETRLLLKILPSAFPIDIIFLNYECLLTLICHLKLIFEMPVI